jgi:8-oxo-dGTP diphosphatase
MCKEGEHMKIYNLIMVLNREESAVLMLRRTKDPYLHKYNFCGGHVEDDEDLLDSAYRELFEESGITKEDITLHPYVDFTWHPIDMIMHVFIGRLTKDVTLVEELHPLHWIDINSDFFDTDTFAGEGNIGHMVQIYHEIRSTIFDD